MATNNLTTMRADKWLWAARFYKTRALALQAINGGKVHVNGERIKPARRLSVGEGMTITKGPYRFAITVEKLNTQRRPAAEASEMYSESQASVNERRALYAERKLQGHGARNRERRPDKRTRGKIRQMKISQSS
ncbi:MAG: S4 domain-containing protein [Gammaproteobacteria bacterium]